MKVLLIILGVILLIGLIPVGAIFRYHGESELKLVIAFLRLRILPKKPLTRKQAEKKAAKKAKKEAKKKEKKKKKQAQSLIAKPPEPPKPKQPLTDRIRGLIPWAKLGAHFVGEFFHRKLCVKYLRIRAALAGGDTAKLARNIGKAWEAIGIALPILEQGFKIKKRQIAVYPDYLADKTDLEAELYVRLRIGGVVCILLKYAFKAIKVPIQTKKEKKQNKKQQPDPRASETEPAGKKTTPKINAKAV